MERRRAILVVVACRGFVAGPAILVWIRPSLSAPAEKLARFPTTVMVRSLVHPNDQVQRRAIERLRDQYADDPRAEDAPGRAIEEGVDDNGVQLSGEFRRRLRRLIQSHPS